MKLLLIYKSNIHYTLSVYNVDESFDLYMFIFCILFASMKKLKLHFHLYTFVGML